MEQQLNAKDLQVKTYLTANRKVGGRVIQEALEAPVENDEEGLENLLDGISSDEIEEGKEKLFAEHPELANEPEFSGDEMEGILQIDANTKALANKFVDPVHVASVKKVGKLLDKETTASIDFKKVGNMVVLSTDDGQIIDTLSSKQFENLIKNNNFVVL